MAEPQIGQEFNSKKSRPSIWGRIAARSDQQVIPAKGPRSRYVGPSVMREFKADRRAPSFNGGVNARGIMWHVHRRCGPWRKLIPAPADEKIAASA